MAGWASLLGALGVVTFSFGLLSLVIALFQPATDIVWVFGNLGVGAVLLIVSAVVNLDSLRERMSSGEGRRVGKYGTSAVLGAVLSVAILCMIAFLSVRYSQRFDWSEDQVNTLSDQTQKVLAGLDRDIHVTGFFNPLDGPQVRDLLDRYAYESDRIQLEFADPNVRPDLVREAGVEDQDLARGLVRIASGPESTDIVEEFSEMAITNAIVKLTRSGGRKVAFATGHNERAIQGEAAQTPRGYERARGALENETYGVEELLLASVADVPEDVDVLVLAGPTRPLLPEEHDALGRYLGRGGALMVMVDPRANTDLGDDLAKWGIELGDDVVVDQRLALFGRATTPFAGVYDPAHPITREMTETTMFHIARSVRPVGLDDGSLVSLVSSGDGSFAERDLAAWQATGRPTFDEGVDLPGPVPLAVAGTPSGVEGEGAAEAKIVVFGDSDFASNELIENFRNRDLFLNSVNWLLGDVESISIRPNTARASRFQLSAEEFRRLQFLSLFVVPETIALVGAFVWWSRRERPEGSA